jgi:two-component system nitrogen regulation response regulator NtrX
LTQQAERSGRAAPTITDEALGLLAGQPWPGNVRQLRNALEAAAVFANGESIAREEVEQVLGAGPGLVQPPRAHAALGADPYDAPSFEEFKNLSESQFFRYRLERNDGNVKRTAEELGMQRSHLYKKLERYGLK